MTIRPAIKPVFTESSEAPASITHQYTRTTTVIVTSSHITARRAGTGGSGWGTWIRTKIDGVRVRCSTVELFPKRRTATAPGSQYGASSDNRHTDQHLGGGFAQAGKSSRDLHFDRSARFAVGFPRLRTEAVPGRRR